MSKTHTALITGASRGIGFEIAKALAQSGMQTLITGRDRKSLTRVKEFITDSGAPAPIILIADLSKKDGASRLARQMDRMSLAPDVLVNNAGWGGPFHQANQVPAQEWDAIFQLNLASAASLCANLLPKMKKKGFGRIVNISSVQGLFGASGSSTYSASKHGLIGYTKSLAAEWGPSGITANVICPGFIDTAMGEGHRKDGSQHQKLLARIPVGRFGTPHEVAAAVAFLCGPSASYFNGSVITIDGGLSAQLDPG